MIRLASLVCGIVLVMGSHTLLLAQHRGGRTGGVGSGRPTGASGSDDLKDFKLAVALQASPDQITLFRPLIKSTQAARKSAQDLLQLASDGSKPDLSQNTAALSSAVEEAQTNNERFLRSFSEAQKSALKNLTKKLKKKNAEITKQSKALGRTPAHSGSDAKQVTSAAEKLDKTLSDFETNLSAPGTQVGIQPEGSSQ